MTFTFYRHLRIGFMLAWVIAWNALLGIGIMLDKQAGSSPSSYFSGMFAVALIGTSLLCLSVLYLPRMQTHALRTDVTVADVRPDLWRLAALAAALGMASVIGLALGG
ncbi:MAG: hypothetical protein FWC58_09600 [Desulfobulbus sp.]|nr:hypothetical protein [Desulfobulbus sp.]